MLSITRWGIILNKKKVAYVLALVSFYVVSIIIYTVMLGIEFSLVGFICTLIFGVTCQYSKLWLGSFIISNCVTLLYLYPRTSPQVKQIILKKLNKE